MFFSKRINTFTFSFTNTINTTIAINTTILNDQTISKYTVETAVDIESLETQSVLTNVITSLIQEWSSAFKLEGIVLPFQNMSSSLQKNSKTIHCY